MTHPALVAFRFWATVATWPSSGMLGNYKRQSQVLLLGWLICRPPREDSGRHSLLTFNSRDLSRPLQIGPLAIRLATTGRLSSRVQYPLSRTHSQLKIVKVTDAW